jgi:hypothetical protein
MTAFMDPERGRRQDPWLFFEAYKHSGEGSAVVRPEMDSFSHVTEESKVKDRALLERKKGKTNLRIQREVGADAFAFENFLTAQAMEHNWFGGEIVATTEYDDWVSGADAVVEWKTDGEPLRLAIDFTSAKREHVFFKKSEKLDGDVVVKYLRSKAEPEKEMRARVPAVILGFDKSIFEHIATSGETVGPDHPLKRMLLEQAYAQIQMQIHFSLIRGFISPKARRARVDDGTKEQIANLTEDDSKEKLLEFYQGLEQKSRDLIFAPKYRDRISRLLDIEQRLEQEVGQAKEEISLGGTWADLEQSSKTHHILSK